MRCIPYREKKIKRKLKRNKGPKIWNEKNKNQVIQSDLLIHWCGVTNNPWKGHLTIPKRSQRMAWNYSLILQLSSWEFGHTKMIQTPPWDVLLVPRTSKGSGLLEKTRARKILFSETQPLQVDGIGPHVMYWLKCTWHLAMYVTPWGKLTKQNISG